MDEWMGTQTARYLNLETKRTRDEIQRYKAKERERDEIEADQVPMVMKRPAMIHTQRIEKRSIK